MTLPKLHIRDLFWLVLVCALATAFWLERVRDRQRLAELQQDLEKWAAEVSARDYSLTEKQAGLEVREREFRQLMKKINDGSDWGRLYPAIISPAHEQLFSTDYPPQ